MVTTDNIQSVFLEQVRKRLPSNISFADELSEILSISRDSAYRRIRGETVLTLDEVKKICTHYGVSLDALLSPSSQMVSFHHRAIDHTNFTFEKWLKSILDNLDMIAGFEQKQIYYLAKDFAPFYYFYQPELSAFKMFFFLKSLLLYPEYVNKKFSFDVVPQDYIALGKRIWNKFTLVDSTELWSDEILNVTLRQIEFYYDCGFFHNPKDAQLICDQFLKVIADCREWAASGYKNGKDGKITIYKNDIIIANNTFLFRMGDKRVVFNTHNSMELLTTSHESFCLQTEKYITNLLNKSVLISTTGEKERNKFFNQMEEKILAVKSKLK